MFHKFFKEIINSDFDFSQHIDDFVNFHSERTEYGKLVSSILQNIVGNRMYQFCNNIIPKKKVKDIYIDIYNKIFNKTTDISQVEISNSILEDIQTKKKKDKADQNTELGNIEEKIKKLKNTFTDNERELLDTIKEKEDNLTKQLEEIKKSQLEMINKKTVKKKRKNKQTQLNGQKMNRPRV